MIKKGIIMDYNGKEAVLLTQSGEFLKIKPKYKVEIGQEYTHEEFLYKKQLLIAASFLICALLSIFTFMYNQVYASLLVTINPQFKIDINKFQRIIRVIPLNEDAEKILKKVNLKNKNIDDGLIMIVNKAKDEKFISNEYYNKTKAIRIIVDGKGVKLTKFANEMKKQRLNFERIDKGQELTKDKKVKEKIKDNKKENDKNTNKNLSPKKDTKTKINDNINKKPDNTNNNKEFLIKKNNNKPKPNNYNQKNNSNEKRNFKNKKVR